MNRRAFLVNSTLATAALAVGVGTKAEADKLDLESIRRITRRLKASAVKPAKYIVFAHPEYVGPIY